jgi:hypothetical protein
LLTGADLPVGLEIAAGRWGPQRALTASRELSAIHAKNRCGAGTSRDGTVGRGARADGCVALSAKPAGLPNGHPGRDSENQNVERTQVSLLSWNRARIRNETGQTSRENTAL